MTTTSTAAPPATGIVLAGLSKTFRTPQGPIHAVRGIDVSIAPGETVAILGPNGAGKSTTIDMLLGLSDPDAGSVAVFGMTPRQAIGAGAVGAMLQTGGLPQGLTVRELVTMMAGLYDEPLPVEEVLEISGVTAVANQRTNKLSGGQTQRVRAAIALISNPDLLILDEPTVAMDVETRHGFWQSMRGFATVGKTVVFATHYLEEADSFADRIVLMARGKVIADGPTTEIKATVGLRTIRATLPGVAAGDLVRLAGVKSADLRGEAVVLHCTDSDSAIKAMIATYPQARDFEILGAGLEEAFLALTGDDMDETMEAVPA